MPILAVVMLRRLARSTRASVLVEFALAAPVLLILYMGGFVVSDMIAANRKVTIATRELTDLLTRNISPSIVYNSPSSASATTYLSAAAVVLAPYDLSQATEEVALLRVCDANHAYVVWSKAQTQDANGGNVTAATPSTTAGTLPANQTQSSANVVSIPDNMISPTMIPSSPDGTNVCSNLAPGTSTRTQVGTAGGWLFMGKVNYTYVPIQNIIPLTTTHMSDVIYMSPRLS